MPWYLSFCFQTAAKGKGGKGKGKGKGKAKGQGGGGGGGGGGEEDDLDAIMAAIEGGGPAAKPKSAVREKYRQRRTGQNVQRESD